MTKRFWLDKIGIKLRKTWTTKSQHGSYRR